MANLVTLTVVEDEGIYSHTVRIDGVLAFTLFSIVPYDLNEIVLMMDAAEQRFKRERAQKAVTQPMRIVRS